MKKIFFMTVLTAAAALTSCQPEKKTEKMSGIHYEYLDETARPGDDFFRYATGHWLDHNPQPAIFPRWGSFIKLSDDNTQQIASLIQSLAATSQPKGSIAQKIGDLYNLSMDSVRLNQEGFAPIRPYLERIQALTSREELLAMLAREHDDILFGIGLGADEKDAKNNIVAIYQSGLSLGNRDYYLSKDPEIVKVRNAFADHIVRTLVLTGLDEKEATRQKDIVLRYETELAEVSYSNEQLRIPEDNYHKLDIAALKKTCNGFDWDTYLKHYGYDATSVVDLGQPAPVAKACAMLLQAPLEDLKVIYQWRLIDSLSGLTSDDFVNENFRYSQALTGAKEQQPRWRRSVNRVDALMGEAVGQMYVEKYFPAESKQRMLDLVHNLQESLADRIKAQTWMSDSTKQVALEKLASFYVKIGYPDKWEDLSKLEVDSTRSLVDNVVAISKFYWNLDKERHYNKPVDRDEWGMTPQTVNAYYNPTTNEICFPAGILQPPFFSKDFDDAVNYGAIGVVIGHEMTHGFDDQGRQYDKEGNLRQWWLEADIEAFQKPADQMAAYFDSLWVIPESLHANGKQCLGENLADHGGLNVAYNALQIARSRGTQNLVEDENGFTPEQRFFLSFANVWAGVTSEALLRRYALVDVHSANFLRVNGSVAQCEAWYKAFNIQPTDSLYVAPENRIDMW